MKLFLCSSATSHHHTNKNKNKNNNHNSTIPAPCVHKDFSETITGENIDDAESIIRKWNFDAHSNSFSSLFANEDKKEAKIFLGGVASLQRAMLYYVKLNSNSEKLIIANELMPIAMKRLEREFYVILSSKAKYLDDSGSSDSVRTIVASGEITEEESPKASDIAVEDLKSIAECMITSGYRKECIVVYKLIRRSVIDEALYNLGVEKLSQSNMQKMEWTVLEAKIKQWLYAVRAAMKTVFQGERALCDAVFTSSEKISESCFAEICRDAALNLFTFAENFGRSKRILSPEKMFRSLDMYEAVAELSPEIESIFSHESLSQVRTAAEAAMVKLGEAVRVMLTQFEAAIKKDASKSPAGGGIHPLTRYVMNYMVFLADYSGSMTDIIVAGSPSTKSPESYFVTPTAVVGGEDTEAASLADRLAWLILVLLCKLDAKAVNNDVALSYLFMANNLNYVVSKVRNSNLGILIGVDWISKHGSKVNQYLATYETMGWREVISSLPTNPTAEISHESAKECFRRFNTGFHETYKRQASWVIPDPKLRDEVKISISEKLVPGYRALYHGHRVKVGVDEIVKYAPEDLDNYLSDLFFEAVGIEGRRFRHHRVRMSLIAPHTAVTDAHDQCHRLLSIFVKFTLFFTLMKIQN